MDNTIIGIELNRKTLDKITELQEYSFTNQILNGIPVKVIDDIADGQIKIIYNIRKE